MSQGPFEPDTNERRRRVLSFDELIALFVAFTTLGSVMFWGMTRSGPGFLDTAAITDDLELPVSMGDADGLANGDSNSGDLGSGADDSDADAATRSPLDGITQQFGGDGLQPSPDSFVGDLSRSSRQANRTFVSSATDAIPGVSAAGLGTGADGSAGDLPPQTAQPANLDAAADLEPTRPALSFEDVPADYWAKPYIDALSARQVIDGIDPNSFKPEEAVTRAQLASVMSQTFPLEAETDAISFGDVPADFWANEAIDQVVRGGYMKGFTDGSFKPNLPVPRAQALTALVSGLEQPDAQTASTDVLSRYTDADQIPQWAVDKMAAATEAGLVVNHPNLDALAPNQTATRAEVAAMIYQALVAQGRVEPIAGPYVVEP